MVGDEHFVRLSHGRADLSYVATEHADQTGLVIKLDAYRGRGFGDSPGTGKTHRTTPAALHALLYTVPFLVLTRAPLALLVICGSHFLIDRWRSAR